MRQNKYWLLDLRHCKESIFKVCSSLHWFEDFLLYYKLLQLEPNFELQIVKWSADIVCTPQPIYSAGAG